MSEPLVSVIIPVYNGENYLKQAIDSVLNQTYKQIEVIVVNDGSTDNGATENIALSYGDKIRYFYKDNGGVATALNYGISQMSGKYFAWLSHDDIFYPDKIRMQVQILMDTEYRMTACAYDIFWDNGRKIAVPFVDFYGKENTEKSVFSVIQSLIQFGGVLFDKEIFDEYGTFREDLRTTQDYEFLFRVLRKEKCVFQNECLYGIRYHDSQGSVTIGSVNVDRDEMYQMFMKKLTDFEKEYLYGSVYCFYYQMLLRVWPMPEIDEAKKVCIEKLNEYSEDSMDTNNLEDVYIYGAGAYGKRLLFDLRCRGINVLGFIDGNSSLWGVEIQGVKCFPLVNFKNQKQVHIIIASIYREEIREQLLEFGMTNVCYKEEYEQPLIKHSPNVNKIMTVINEYEKCGWIT